uniref:Uncharacterized protein n=1 Tax=Chromera velia CCMP2878 TaxID=1169474 RepID=A0A0G4FZJ1_9ALVE|eukprot:Cvel_19552.t1-p1 / transcript=Cvel_19552.t1 / gene=Cvel_19552 / organism=Chromera_velia_CCMP2878 / gene_product=hypothetical protein / transcript_product=hypothetical protein / location=Cvel_scaffold1694:29734-30057(-) / protein_length=108 / sequence_SO=supercontig / SO=protein_coding / is_pseudo=false
MNSHVRCKLPLQVVVEGSGFDDRLVASIIESLAHAGANLDQSTPTGQTPLSAACSRQLVKTAQVLVGRGVTVGCMSRKGELRMSPLIESVKGLNEPLVSVLLEGGQTL